jgi:hypothetical protein
MKHARVSRLLAVALAAAPALAWAQEPGPPGHAPAGPPVQRIATASAVSPAAFGAIAGVRELPDGRVLVNDGARRRLLLMDTALKTTGVVLDSLAGVANAYGTRPGILIPFRGDSTLFVDPASYAMLVLDPASRIARVRSVWRVEHLPFLTSGWPGVDARGRIVYRVAARPDPPRVPPPGGVPYIPPNPDSAFIVAMDLGTRRADTLGAVRVPRSGLELRRSREGSLNISPLVYFLSTVDEWAILADGTVAFVRGRDYRVDYHGADGKLTSSGRIPFDWQRLTDDDKDRLVDSVKTAQERSSAGQYVAAMITWVNQYRKAYPSNFRVPAGYVLPPGLPRDARLPRGVSFPDNYIYACPPGVEPSAPTMVAMGLPPGFAANAGGSVRMSMSMAGPAGAAPPVTPSPGPAPGSDSTRGVVRVAAPPDAPSPGAASGSDSTRVVRVVAPDAGMVPGAAPPTGADSGRAVRVAMPAGVDSAARAAGVAGAAAAAAARAAAGPDSGRAMVRVAAPPAVRGGAPAMCLPAPVMFGGNVPAPTPRTVRVEPASDLPDYRPPFGTGAVRADMDGNLWIQTTRPNPGPGGPIFDVVDRSGVLVQRLQLPVGYTVVGFGRGRVVYLSMRDPGGIHLARVRLR